MSAVWLASPALGLRFCPLLGFSVAGEVLERFERDTGLRDFYVVYNGRIVDRDEPLRDGSIYHLEPRLQGGKGGFGSMLRALGAQIEKTTNREACRDLSGRRLRDVNHEKEMADWLKKQSEREAEKEQRRLERLQKKLAEPKHHFTDPKYTQQCHELSERLEDSVIKGLQASSSSVVRADSTKRVSEERNGPECKKSRGNFTWTGLDLDMDSEEDLDSEEEPIGRGAESEGSAQSGSSSPAPSEDQPSGSRPSLGPSLTLEAVPESSCGPKREPQARPESSYGPKGESQARPESSCGPEGESQARPESSCGPEGEPQARPESSFGPEGESQARPESSCGPEGEPQAGPESSCGPEGEPQAGPESSCGPEGEPQARPESSCGPDGDQGESSMDEAQSKPESSPDQKEETQEQHPLDLDSVLCAKDLEALGLNALKEELMRRGLKCGGTLPERAARLFSVRGKAEGDVNPTLIAKNGKKRNKQN